MGLLERIKSKLTYKFHSLMKPEIIGYSKWNSISVKELRISNLTHISKKGQVNLSNYTFIGHFNYLDGHSGLKIGEGVQITNYVNIITHSSHDAIRLMGKSYDEKEAATILNEKSVEIGDYTYVGPNSVIMPGSKIGKGCIISANSYIDGVVDDFSIIRGKRSDIVGSTLNRDNGLLDKYPEFRKTYYLVNSEL